MDKQFNSLLDFLAVFKDEAICIKHFEQIRWRNGEYCPHCGHTSIYRMTDGKRYRCAKCKQDFTIKTKTIFGESKISLQKWFVAIYLLTTSTKGISSIQLSKHVGVTQKTAWHMDHRIRKAMKQGKGQLFDTVECDETYIGGKEKNKHASKRTKGTQGRNTLTKTPVMGLQQRGGDVKANVIENVKMRTLEKLIVEHVKMGTMLYTDDFTSYGKIGTLYPHEVVKHGHGEYVRDGVIHSNSMESFWALFKRGYMGTYHHMSKKHLQKYVDEFTFRYNRRGVEMSDVFDKTVMNIAASEPLHYKTLVAA